MYINGSHFDALVVAESTLIFLSILTRGRVGTLLWTGGVDRLLLPQFINATPAAATFGFEKAE